MQKFFPKETLNIGGYVPDAVAVPEVEQPMTDEQLEAGLPKPTGYKLLLAMPQVDKKFKGSVIEKVESTVAAETITSVVALVIDMGPDAYQDEKRFPSGPWCKPGDYVLLRPYQGTRFILNNQEYRVVPDDSIDGTVNDPSGYRRV